jgi:hypothetical protein
MKALFILLMVSSLLAVTACVEKSMYTPVSQPGKLMVSFADPKWDGNKVPAGCQCSSYGGSGGSPALLVKGIPAGADAVVVKFNDRDYAPLSTDGGHGAIWVSTGGKSTLTVPSVPGETDSMPPGVNVESAHRGSRWSGVYLPPCSGGRGNRYMAEVLAVKRAGQDGKGGQLLASGMIELGTY